MATTPVFSPGKSHGQRRLAIVHGVAKSWARLRTRAWYKHRHPTPTQTQQQEPYGPSTTQAGPGPHSGTGQREGKPASPGALCPPGQCECRSSRAGPRPSLGKTASSSTPAPTAAAMRLQVCPSEQSELPSTQRLTA